MKEIKVGPVILKRRTAKLMTGLKLADATDNAISQGTLSRIESKEESVTIANLAHIATALDTTVTDLIREAEGLPEPDKKTEGVTRVPLISWVQAGELMESVPIQHDFDTDKSVIPPCKTSARAFALTVKGDSMTSMKGDSFPDGSHVIVEPGKRPENGSMVVATFEGCGESTFKQLVIDGPFKYLSPLNPSYQAIPIDERTRIVGVVTGMTKVVI